MLTILLLKGSWRVQGVVLVMGPSRGQAVKQTLRTAQLPTSGPGCQSGSAAPVPEAADIE